MSSFVSAKRECWPENGERSITASASEIKTDRPDLRSMYATYVRRSHTSDIVSFLAGLLWWRGITGAFRKVRKVCVAVSKETIM